MKKGLLLGMLVVIVSVVLMSFQTKEKDTNESVLKPQCVNSQTFPVVNGDHTGLYLTRSEAETALANYSAMYGLTYTITSSGVYPQVAGMPGASLWYFEVCGEPKFYE